MSSTVHLDNTMGLALIGIVVAALLYGVSLLQVYYYYTHQKDTWCIKWLVGLVMIFETIHQALITHSVYVYLVTYYGQPEMRKQIVWCVIPPSACPFALLTPGAGAYFFTMRVWRLSNRKIWLTGLLVRTPPSLPLSRLINLTGATCCWRVRSIGCAIAPIIRFTHKSAAAYTILSLQLRTFTELARLKSLSIAVNALAAAGDLLIAASLCIILYQSRTGFQRSDTMIKKLIVYSVNTGLFTSLCAVASLISIVLAGHTFLYVMFFFCMGRLYSNSLLAALNARKKIRAVADGIYNTSDNVSLSLREFPRSGGISMTTKHPTNTNISIKIDTTKEFTTDLIHECGRDVCVGVNEVSEKRNEIGMTFARRASNSTTTTFADPPLRC
ncbi:hypothetical protein AN958_04354 [Leucoagaricus sp. SymC.cos]|nr:hypothetical protein AN958_04354 [Leucoagaricus sp. SymC.cos]